MDQRPDDETEWVDWRDWYDGETAARLDSYAPSSAEPRLPGWRRHTLAGAIITGLVLGYKDVFEPDEEPGIVEIDVAGREIPLVNGVRLFFVAGDPVATTAVVDPN